MLGSSRVHYVGLCIISYLSLETFLGIGSVGDGSDETVAVDYGVGALDYVTVPLFLAVLVVGVLVVVHIKTELVGR